MPEEIEHPRETQKDEPGAANLTDLLGKKPLTLAALDARRIARQGQQQTYIESVTVKAKQLEQRRAEAKVDVGYCDPPYPCAEYEPGQAPTEVPLNSLEGSVGYGSLVRAMYEAGRRRVAFYRSTEGGSLSPEEAWAATYRNNGDTELAYEELDNLMSRPFDIISLVDLTPLVSVAPELAEILWERIKLEGQAEFESGHLAARAVTSVSYRRSAWNIACFMGIRESFAEQWGVKGGIDAALIDMLAQAFWMVQFWTKQVDTRMQDCPRGENQQFLEWKRWQKETNQAQWEHGSWDRPYVSQQQALDHATAQVEKWNRMFLRTLRNLRDLRRYAPVTINNPAQVNIATDGGRQVNVQADKDTMPNKANRLP